MRDGTEVPTKCLQRSWSFGLAWRSLTSWRAPAAGPPARRSVAGNRSRRSGCGIRGQPVTAPAPPLVEAGDGRAQAEEAGVRLDGGRHQVALLSGQRTQRRKL